MLAVFALVGIAALSFVPAHSAFAANGTIQGGKYTVDIKGTAVPLESDNTTITLTPAAPGSVINVSGGNIKITNVPPGTYSVNINFRFDQKMCDKNWVTSLLSIASPPFLALCKFTNVGATYFTYQKTISGVVVPDGGTVTLDPKNGSLGAAIHSDANGNPILDCSGKGIIMSFVICPMIENMLGIINWVIEGFIQPYLAVNPLTTTVNGQPSELYQIWNNIRNFANIIFIGAFFAIIFSQATSIGISNYGIKKLLPRLILIGIATNVSFFICAFLIDVFNILGVGIGSLLVSGVTNGSLSLNLGNGDLIGFLAIPALISPLGPLVIAAGAAIIFGAFVFLFIVAIIFFITAVVIILRQIILIFLVIAAPVAFVAGLLPNTQNFFNQWFKIFVRLLAMYPLIMALFAAGKIASVVMERIGSGG
jgi:hypothetical protein